MFPQLNLKVVNDIYLNLDLSIKRNSLTQTAHGGWFAHLNSPSFGGRLVLFRGVGQSAWAPKTRHERRKVDLSELCPNFY